MKIRSVVSRANRQTERQINRQFHWCR